MTEAKGLEYIWVANTILAIIFFVLGLVLFSGVARSIVGEWLAGVFLLAGFVLLLLGREGFLMDFTDPSVRRFSISWGIYGVLFSSICIFAIIGGNMTGMPALFFFLVAVVMAVSANLLIQRRKLGWLLSLLAAAFWMLAGASTVVYSFLESTKTPGFEIAAVISFALLFLPGVLICYYLTRPNIRKQFE